MTRRKRRGAVVLAGFRNRRWEAAHADVYLTKGLLKNMRAFGYTKVRYVGPDGVVDKPIGDLL